MLLVLSIFSFFLFSFCCALESIIQHDEPAKMLEMVCLLVVVYVLEPGVGCRIHL